MNDWLAALLLGIIEGITEFLPISSTGHLLVAEHWLGARSDLFNIGIQSGAIVAVALIYRQRLVQLVRDFVSGESRDYVWKLGVAFAITVALGLVVAATDFQLPETVGPVAWALVIGGFWMLGAEHLAARKADNAEVSWRVAILVGLAQIVAAIFPGTSRSGATIFVAMLAGTSNRAAATEFAFLLGIPTLLAATGYQLLKSLHAGTAAHEDWTLLGIAFVASTITAFIAVKWLLGYIVGHRFTAFAFYRIVLGIALLLWLPH
ncbi:MAG: undecaprenyl-diphosphate phosphatase [Xanthomonadales bacterium]|nr:undecaprenyl-diphosphate phosphatase [Xanthomonadales bacterium]